MFILKIVNIIFFSLIYFFFTEGPCLVHTITGDLLRALEGPENCLRPRLISVSSEGHCIIYYERGHFCNFSINGKLLAQMEINDSTRVSGEMHVRTEINTQSKTVSVFNLTLFPPRPFS